MDDDSPVRRLVNQCKSNDIDARVDAITKLQAEFEAGAEIPDADALVQALKACLRTPNQHLTTATLSALPPLVPLLATRHPAQIPLPSSSTSPAASTTSSAAGASPIDAHALRQLLTQLMPAGGGVLDRLGDARERARDKARETLVVFGSFAFRCGGGGGGSALRSSRDGKGPETPLQLFERFLREGGLTSKVWRAREQSILVLVHIRRSHHMFPLRPYLPHLVDALEDTDGAVRECARQSVVELFTGPGVTDAARADLKKELTKKNVRKTIVDGVLNKVLAGSTGASTPASRSEAGSENGDAPGKEYVPPSIALMNRRPGAAPSGGAGSVPVSRTVSMGNVRELPRPVSRAATATPASELPPATGGGTDVKPVYIASSRDLENEFASMLRPFEGKETEHNWSAREQAIQRVRGMLKGDVLDRYADTFLQGLKNGYMEASLKTLASLRTTVAGNTCALYAELSIALGPALDPFCELLFTHLLRMANLTKKLTAQTSQATVTTLIQTMAPSPKMVIPLIWTVLQDKAIQTRQYAVNHVKTFLEVHGARTAHSMEATGVIEQLEKIVRKALGDPNAGVRDNARQLFWIFQALWTERGAAIMQALDTTSRKQLEKACPSTDLLASVPTVAASPPRVKKSSVAAAIAASRAKAKAIATAPPTLRHQATSASHTIRATSPPTKRPTSPALSTSSSTGGVRAQSPVSRASPPRSRIVSSGTLSRSVSSGAVPARTTPRQPPSPPSPTTDQTLRRRPPTLTPSPPTSNSTFRKAMETALPASPPLTATTFVSPTPRPQKAGQPPAVPVQRESLSLAGLRQLAGSSDEESLLLATYIPIPEDSDSDMDMDLDESVNLISFSTPYEVYPPLPAPRTPARTHSPARSFSPRSTSSKPALSNALSTGTSASPPAGAAQPLVEDAMRARAEQAESAAERLLELVEPEEDGAHAFTSPIPASLLLRNTESGAAPPVRGRTSSGSAPPALPRTPVSKRSAAIMQQAALFQDSPAPNGKSASFLFDMVDGRDRAGQWWAKRMACIAEDGRAFCARGRRHPGWGGRPAELHRGVGRRFGGRSRAQEARAVVRAEPCGRAPLAREPGLCRAPHAVADGRRRACAGVEQIRLLDTRQGVRSPLRRARQVLGSSQECRRTRVWPDRPVGNAGEPGAVARRARSGYFRPAPANQILRADDCDAGDELVPGHAHEPHRARVWAHDPARLPARVPGRAPAASGRHGDRGRHLCVRAHRAGQVLPAPARGGARGRTASPALDAHLGPDGELGHERDRRAGGRDGGDHRRPDGAARRDAPVHAARRPARREEEPARVHVRQARDAGPRERLRPVCDGKAGAGDAAHRRTAEHHPRSARHVAVLAARCARHRVALRILGGRRYLMPS